MYNLKEKIEYYVSCTLKSYNIFTMLSRVRQISKFSKVKIRKLCYYKDSKHIQSLKTIQIDPEDRHEQRLKLSREYYKEQRRALVFQDKIYDIKENYYDQRMRVNGEYYEEHRRIAKIQEIIN